MAQHYYHQWDAQLKASPTRVRKNGRVTLKVTFTPPPGSQEPDDNFYNEFNYKYTCNDDYIQAELNKCNGHKASFSVPPQVEDGDYDINVQFELGKIGRTTADIDQILPMQRTATITVASARLEANVALQLSESPPTDDQALWAAIRNRTAAVAFPRYQRFIDKIFCSDDLLTAHIENPLKKKLGSDYQLNIFGPYAYGLLKLATQAFLTLECGVVLRENDWFDQDSLFTPENEPIRFGDPTITPAKISDTLERYLVSPDSTRALPYLKKIVEAFVSLNNDRGTEVLPYCEGILKHRLTAPSMIELIWSYWLEEGMLAQTMNAIAWRFQNRRRSGQDPLGELEFDALRPLNNIVWGFIQDEHNRLTVQRRAYEYQHHYGMSLEGKAVGDITPADARSKFIEAFHNLLYRADLFYREDRDTTKHADAFTLLNALKEVHIILAEGAHNQFGDLTWTARAEMLTMQWMLARPEMREFLRGRYMVPYQELWMGAVDSMKKLQGWTDTSIMHFHELAVTGERILLSIRYGNWADISNIEEQAKNWARGCKPEIQRYMHAYRTVTGVDLSAEITDKQEASRRLLPPSALLKERLLSQNGSAAPIAAPRRLRGLAAASPVSANAPAREPARLSKLS